MKDMEHHLAMELYIKVLTGGGGGYYGGNARYAGTNYVNGSYLSNGSNSYGVNSGNGRVVIRLKSLPE